MSEIIDVIPYIIPRVSIEIISAIACFILVKFMIKPYQVTGEGRYIGLPLGFSFLGASYAISAITFTELASFELIWRFELIFRAFSFVFLAVAYYFSKKPSKNTRYIWNVVFSGLFVILSTAVVVTFVAPQLPQDSYLILNFFVRILSFICIAYIFVHCLREKTIAQDPYAKWVLVAYGLLALSQYSSIVWGVDLSFFAFWGTLIFRLMSLAVLLAVTYKIFLIPKKGSER
jgi:hypothetical protein